VAPIRVAYRSDAFTRRLTDGLDQQEALVVIQFRRTIGRQEPVLPPQTTDEPPPAPASIANDEKPNIDRQLKMGMAASRIYVSDPFVLIPFNL